MTYFVKQRILKLTPMHPHIKNNFRPNWFRSTTKYSTHQTRYRKCLCFSANSFPICDKKFRNLLQYNSFVFKERFSFLLYQDSRLRRKNSLDDKICKLVYKEFEPNFALPFPRRKGAYIRPHRQDKYVYMQMYNLINMTKNTNFVSIVAFTYLLNNA